MLKASQKNPLNRAIFIMVGTAFVGVGVFALRHSPIFSYQTWWGGMAFGPFAMGVSRLLCKRPGFVFGMGCRGRVSLPLAIDVVAFHVVIAKLSPRPASVPATES